MMSTSDNVTDDNKMSTLMSELMQRATRRLSGLPGVLTESLRGSGDDVSDGLGKIPDDATDEIRDDVRSPVSDIVDEVFEEADGSVDDVDGLSFDMNDVITDDNYTNSDVINVIPIPPSPPPIAGSKLSDNVDKRIKVVVSDYSNVIDSIDNEDSNRVSTEMSFLSEHIDPRTDNLSDDVYVEAGLSNDSLHIGSEVLSFADDEMPGSANEAEGYHSSNSLERHSYKEQSTSFMEDDDSLAANLAKSAHVTFTGVDDALPKQEESPIEMENFENILINQEVTDLEKNIPGITDFIAPGSPALSWEGETDYTAGTLGEVHPRKKKNRRLKEDKQLTKKYGWKKSKDKEKETLIDAADYHSESENHELRGSHYDELRDDDHLQVIGVGELRDDDHLQTIGVGKLRDDDHLQAIGVGKLRDDDHLQAIGVGKLRDDDHLQVIGVGDNSHQNISYESDTQNASPMVTPAGTLSRDKVSSPVSVYSPQVPEDSGRMVDPIISTNVEIATIDPEMQEDKYKKERSRWFCFFNCGCWWTFLAVLLLSAGSVMAWFTFKYIYEEGSREQLIMCVAIGMLVLGYVLLMVGVGLCVWGNSTRPIKPPHLRHTQQHKKGARVNGNFNKKHVTDPKPARQNHEDNTPRLQLNNSSYNHSNDLSTPSSPAFENVFTY